MIPSIPIPIPISIPMVRSVAVRTMEPQGREPIAETTKTPRHEEFTKNRMGSAFGRSNTFLGAPFVPSWLRRFDACRRHLDPTTSGVLT